jgi:hypothetical protein
MSRDPVLRLSEVAEFKEVLNDKKRDSSKKYKNILVSHGAEYSVVRYDKDVLCNDLIPTIGLLRSVILNKENKVVSFAPPKSLQSDTFIKKYSTKSDDIIAEEFVEGTMINIFWNPCSGIGGAWEIATRNKVGANAYFYKTKDAKTFRAMFLECCAANGLDYETLQKNLCYCFVMQHPDNRIVVPFVKPQLYLVQVCEIVVTEDGTTNVFIQDMERVRADSVWSGTNVKFPETYDSWTKYADLIDTYASMNTSYDVLGVIIKNIQTGERCKIRNPVYEEIRQLRGNQPKLQYQYLCLRKDSTADESGRLVSKVGEFLKYYPEHKRDFSKFRDQIHLFTLTILQNYISCYIKKEKPLLEFPAQYRTHMFNIHQEYLNDLKEKNLYVTNSVVIKYVNSMHPSKLMYSLNFSMRKRAVDFIKADAEIEASEDVPENLE